MVDACAGKVAVPVQEVKEAVITSTIMHNDETGLRVDKKTVWAHVASTAKLTYITVEQNRGQKGMEASGVLPTYSGITIHDCWAPYFRYALSTHGLCNAHLLRELQGVVENTHQAWAQKLIGLLLRMKKTKEKLLLQNLKGPSPYFLKKYAYSYDEIVAEGAAHNPMPVPEVRRKGRAKRGKVRALVDRLILHKDKFLLFFSDFRVPFDNNQAERDIRMLKVKQKVSGCFRTMKGAENFTAIMSYIGTARKHGLSAFQAIKDALLGNPFSILSVTVD
jgi:transposase